MSEALSQIPEAVGAAVVLLSVYFSGRNANRGRRPKFRSSAAVPGKPFDPHWIRR